MRSYCIVELDDGLTIVEQPAAAGPEDAALRAGGTLVDPGPYRNPEEAYDALLALEQELSDEGSDTPDARVMEDRILRMPT
ncbi:MAG TPA: hypothetical protein VML55_21650 [Planctomycetaceae bacterium]|nr:hypothetical protein [Planctomycetaceae bacterium]